MSETARPSGPAAQETYRLIGRGISCFCLLLLFQASGSISEQSQATTAWWDAVFLWGFLALVAVFAASSIRGWWLRRSSGMLAGLVLAGLVLWPLAVPATVGGDFGTPWLWSMINVGAAWSAFAAGSRIGCLYTVVIGAVFAGVRTTPQGGAASLAVGLQDALFATVLGLIICVTVGILTHAATKVDAAAHFAIESYTQAAAASALAAARLRLDGLLHDSVMTAFVTAAQAASGEERAASARLAASALDRLAAEGAARSEQIPSGLHELAARIRAAVSTSAGGIEVSVREDGPDSPLFPEEVISAVFEAATEAVNNALSHSNGDMCEVRVLGNGEGERSSLLVTVIDNGRGFKPAKVPARRLGIKVSITGRLDAVGGTATIDSRPGNGTEVRLAWTGVLHDR